MILPVSFYRRPTLTVAKELLGWKLVVGGKQAIIVETEAYRGVEDKACHAAWRKKESCLNLWKSGGILYVYLTYGLHWMLNIVTERDGIPSAVLIRALEPISGITGATNGPGKLTKALGIDKSFDGKSVAKPDLYITNGITGFVVRRATRVGVNYAGSWAKKPWRFYIAGNKYVSRL